MRMSCWPCLPGARTPASIAACLRRTSIVALRAFLAVVVPMTCLQWIIPGLPLSVFEQLTMLLAMYPIVLTLFLWSDDE